MDTQNYQNNYSCQIITLNGQLNKNIPLHVIELKKISNEPVNIVILYSTYDYFDCINKFNKFNKYRNSFELDKLYAIANCSINDFTSNRELSKNIMDFYNESQSMK